MLDINYNSQVTRNAPEADIPIYNILDTNYILSLEHTSSENYISKMRLIHTWGGAIEIQCACNIWGLCVNVKNYRDNNNRTIEFIPLNNSYNKTIYVYWNGGHYEPITNM